jgi:hypothetical protein
MYVPLKTSRYKKIEENLKISNERYTYVNMATSDVIWDWQKIPIV